MCLSFQVQGPSGRVAAATIVNNIWTIADYAGLTGYGTVRRRLTIGRAGGWKCWCDIRAHRDAALGAGLRLRRGRRTDGARRSARPGARHCARDRSRRELFRHRGSVRQRGIGKESRPGFAEAQAGQRGRRHQGPAAARETRPHRRRHSEVARSSLARLRLDRVDIFHLHNSITPAGGGPALSVQQVLGEVVPAFERLRPQGKTRFLGITAVGDTASLHQVIDSNAFDSAQVAYNGSIRLRRALPRIIRRRISDGYSIIPRRPAQAWSASVCSPAARCRDRRSGIRLRRRRRADRLGQGLRRRCRARPPSRAANRRGLRREPDRSRHAVCISHPAMGTILVGTATPQQFEDALAAVAKRAAAARRARAAVRVAPEICRRTTVIAELPTRDLAHRSLACITS